MCPVSPGRSAEPRGRAVGPAPPADRSCATPTPPAREQWSGRSLLPEPAGSESCLGPAPPPWSLAPAAPGAPRPDLAVPAPPAAPPGPAQARALAAGREARPARSGPLALLPRSHARSGPSSPPPAALPLAQVQNPLAPPVPCYGDSTLQDGGFLLPPVRPPPPGGRHRPAPHASRTYVRTFGVRHASRRGTSRHAQRAVPT